MRIDCSSSTSRIRGGRSVIPETVADPAGVAAAERSIRWSRGRSAPVPPGVPAVRPGPRVRLLLARGASPAVHLDAGAGGVRRRQRLQHAHQPRPRLPVAPARLQRRPAAGAADGRRLPGRRLRHAHPHLHGRHGRRTAAAGHRDRPAPGQDERNDRRRRPPRQPQPRIEGRALGHGGAARAGAPVRQPCHPADADARLDDRRQRRRRRGGRHRRAAGRSGRRRDRARRPRGVADTAPVRRAVLRRVADRADSSAPNGRDGAPDAARPQPGRDVAPRPDRPPRLPADGRRAGPARPGRPAGGARAGTAARSAPSPGDGATLARLPELRPGRAAGDQRARHRPGRRAADARRAARVARAAGLGDQPARGAADPAGAVRRRRRAGASAPPPRGGRRRG